ncbi:lysylphosphatidylglycerol synthase domain-containing protein [Rhizosphaericola mali]|uniref:lysylphosphatidylglycerol synthase domain-containing protein n=1 Tax=Rhizosphaericola mali TaxID=2545455 RepID=UPI00177CC976|nr:lysylphosphatidylglycerol synthase domain-containing protein [Rhizosphaericola mali]
MARSNLHPKFKKVLDYCVGPLLFVVLTYFIVKNIKETQNITAAWVEIKAAFYSHAWLLSILLLLMCVNWGLEAKKWQLLIRPVQKVSLFTGFQAVLSGLSFSIFIPNGLGEYLGRMMYMQEGKRLRSLSVSFVGSLSQVIITFITGIAGTFLLIYPMRMEHSVSGISTLWLKGLLFVLAGITIVLIILYFKISWIIKWIEKIPFFKKYIYIIQSLETYDTRLLSKVLFFAFVRYIIFILQYLLVFFILGVEMPVAETMYATASMFLLMAIIPTIPAAEVGVRGELSLQLFGLLSLNKLGIISSAILIWLVNLILPALIGSCFVLGIKIFRNK